MSPADPLFWVIVAGSLVSAFVSSAFAIGGGFIMLAIIASAMPMSAVVPMHSALMLGMSFGRSWFFRQHVYWPIVIPFLLGALIGAPLGARIYVGLPEIVIAVTLGVFTLAAVWTPPINWRPPIPHPFFFVGVIHSFLSALFSFGGLMQPLVMRSQLAKMQIIATLAVSLMFMNLIKLSGYAAFGFSFRPYALLVGVAILAALPGAWLGRHYAHRISERHFRLVFRLVMTIFALRLFYRAWTLA